MMKGAHPRGPGRYVGGKHVCMYIISRLEVEPQLRGLLSAQ